MCDVSGSTLSSAIQIDFDVLWPLFSGRKDQIHKMEASDV